MSTQFENELNYMIPLLIKLQRYDTTHAPGFVDFGRSSSGVDLVVSLNTLNCVSIFQLVQKSLKNNKQQTEGGS